MEDRRHMRRFTLRLPCLIYDGKDAGEELLFEAQTINVSTGGALVETQTHLPAGLPVHFNMLVRRTYADEPINASSCVSLAGRVVRTDDAGLGIAFSDTYRIMRTSHLFGRCNAVSQWLQKMKANGKTFCVCEP